MKSLFTIVIILVLFSCGRNNEKIQEDKNAQLTDKNVSKEKDNSEWEEIHAAIVNLDSYDGGRILESGQGFFVGENLVVTKYSLVNQATRVEFSPFDENTKYIATKFVAFDRINDLIILQVDGLKRKPIALFSGQVPNSAKSKYVAKRTGKTIQLFSGKVLNLASVRGTKLYRITNVIRKSQIGTPVFVSNKKAIGIAFSDVVNYKQQSFAIPSMYISDMLKKQNEAQPIEELKMAANAEEAAENKKIKGLVLETDVGVITIRLFNETPEYRDNFIRLAKEQYFDSLLIHRVISDFGIQSGAAERSRLYHSCTYRSRIVSSKRNDWFTQKT